MESNIARVIGPTPPGFGVTQAAFSHTSGARSPTVLWQIEEVDEPTRFTFVDGFAHEDFSNNDDLPASHNEFRFEATEGGTRATYVSTYASAEALQQVLDMGVVEGASGAINQIDALVA